SLGPGALPFARRGDSARPASILRANDRLGERWRGRRSGDSLVRVLLPWRAVSAPSAPVVALPNRSSTLDRLFTSLRSTNGAIFGERVESRTRRFERSGGCGGARGSGARRNRRVPRARTSSAKLRHSERRPGLLGRR